jgi:hypothetical protein
VFFWVFPRHQIVFFRRFGTLCQVHLQRLHTPHRAFEDGPDRRFRNVRKTQSDTGEIPKRTYTRLLCLFTCTLYKVTLDYCISLYILVSSLERQRESITWKSNCLSFPTGTMKLKTLPGRGTRWSSGWGTALKTGMSRDRFPMVSLEFLIDIILPAALWPWGRLIL